MNDKKRTGAKPFNCMGFTLLCLLDIKKATFKMVACDICHSCFINKEPAVSKSLMVYPLLIFMNSNSSNYLGNFINNNTTNPEIY